MKTKLKRKAPQRRNPVARALRLLRPKVKPSDKIYTRKGASIAPFDILWKAQAGGCTVAVSKTDGAARLSVRTRGFPPIQAQQ